MTDAPLPVEISGHVIGDEWPDHTLTVYDENGALFDTTGYTAAASVKTEDGITVSLTAAVAASVVTLSFPATTTAKFAETNTIQARITDGTSPKTVCLGTVAATIGIL